MKKRLVQSLLFLAIVCSSTLYSSPVMGTDYNIQTGVAVQECTTNLTAGITRTMSELLCEEYEEISIECTFEPDNWRVGWITTKTKVRDIPSVDSEILDIYYFNTTIQYCKYNEEWSKIQYPLGIAYIKSDCISDKELDYIDYNVPATSGFKSYMPYTSITSKSSLQYKLQQKANTGNFGIRMINNRYCVAIGTGFNADVGTYFDLILVNGTIIPCIVGDIKSNKHTDKNNMITVSNGCLTEFIVDKHELDRNAKRMGDISYCCEEWNSRVENIRVYDKNVFRKEM